MFLCTAKLHALEEPQGGGEMLPSFTFFLKGWYIPAAASIKPSCFMRLLRKWQLFIYLLKSFLFLKDS